jgi:hypothetical protein
MRLMLDTNVLLFLVERGAADLLAGVAALLSTRWIIPFGRLRAGFRGPLAFKGRLRSVGVPHRKDLGLCSYRGADGEGAGRGAWAPTGLKLRSQLTRAFEFIAPRAASVR